MINGVRNIAAWAIGPIRRLKLIYKVGLVLLAFAAFTFGTVEVTGTTGFCNSCHVMNPFYDSWKTSAHAQVNCLDCHIQPGVKEYAKGKLTGLAQAVDCMVGRVGTNPSATVYDNSCLRSGCHDTQTLREDAILFGDIRFTHKNHIEKVVDGLEISCATCHSHYDGEQHFSVKAETCYTCHFLKSEQSGERLVQTTCLSCHQLPQDSVQRGSMAIDHQELLTYEASCDTSCHKRQIERESQVAENSCLSCHSFRKSNHVMASESLPRLHTGKEKVECWGCHGEIPHGPTFAPAMSGMIDCQDCHTGTHSIQRGIYMADNHLAETSSSVLGPMFMTHVECKGCHIGQAEDHAGIAGSQSMVTRAVPAACDRCHQPGTGDQYVPFWQKQTKQLHAQVSAKITDARDYVQSQQDPELIKRLNERISQAQSLLDTIESDGSWGVHNFKYTEAILSKARRLLDMSGAEDGSL